MNKKARQQKPIEENILAESRTREETHRPAVSMKKIRRFLQRSKTEPVRHPVSCTNISFWGDYDRINSLRLVKACSKVRRRPRAAINFDDDDTGNKDSESGFRQRPAKLKRSQTTTYGSAETPGRILLRDAMMALRQGLEDGDTNRELERLIQEVIDAHLSMSDTSDSMSHWDLDEWSLFLYRPQKASKSPCLQEPETAINVTEVAKRESSSLARPAAESHALPPMSTECELRA